jgi:hypothetical protein
MDGVLVRDRVKKKGEFQHLRVAFRRNYMNFYCGGQSIAMVNFGRDGLQAKIHKKYVYGCKGAELDSVKSDPNVKLTSKGIQELSTGGLVPCCSPQEWITNANSKIGHEKRFVDLIVAHNPDVMDLEMGLPAYSDVPNAPRIDLVALEPHEGGKRVVFWEVKLVCDGRARCEGTELPEVVTQLEAYTKWLSDDVRAQEVIDAYRNNCRLLVGLHEIANSNDLDIGELGPGIQKVAASGETSLSVDPKPRLLIIYDRKDESFRQNQHLNKLRGAGWQVQTVESLSELALCGRR